MLSKKSEALAQLRALVLHLFRMVGVLIDSVVFFFGFAIRAKMQHVFVDIFLSSMSIPVLAKKTVFLLLFVVEKTME